MLSRKTIILAAVALLAVIAIIVAIFNAVNKPPQDIDTATVTSPFTHTSTEVVPYYKADYAEGDEDAVNTEYIVFSLDTLKVSDDIKSALQYGAPMFLKGYQEPSVEPVFIHLDTSSVKYKNESDFSFNFYTDSPEGYFSYTVKPEQDSQSTVTIMPIGGGWL